MENIIKLRRYWSDEAIAQALGYYLNDIITADGLVYRLVSMPEYKVDDFYNKFIAGDFIVDER